ncbi:MAG TPA: hypothetical protein VEN81_03400, partial [Planctomycetota bacterium]|nr:hypothetical protein [Planctomycetota bacterium]
SETVLRIPHRPADSKIATVWTHQGADDEDGDDEPKGDGNKGDGLTNYEEYRGFMEGGVWKEGDPTKKDFFVRNEVPAMASAGVDLFESISKLKVHRLDKGEFRASDRVINFNHDEGPHKTDQHIVRIFFDPTCDHYCQALMKNGPSTPKNLVDGVHVGVFTNIAVVGFSDKGLGARMYADGALAHELLHCCNVYHHGDPPGEGLRKWIRTAAGEVQENGQRISVYDEAGTLIDAALTEGTSLKVDLKIRMEHGLASGPLGCVMRYDDTDAYILPGRPGDRLRMPNNQSEPSGFTLCTSTVGNGPAGNADVVKHRGNCAGQILVNDGVTAPNRK